MKYKKYRIVPLESLLTPALVFKNVIDMNNYSRFIALKEMRGNITPFMTYAQCALIYHEIKNKSPKEYSEREEIPVYCHTQQTQRKKIYRVEHKRNEESFCCEVGCNKPAVTTYSIYHYCNLHRPICIVPKCNQVINSESKNKCYRCYCSSMVC